VGVDINDGAPADGNARPTLMISHIATAQVLTASAPRRKPLICLMSPSARGAAQSLLKNERCPDEVAVCSGASSPTSPAQTAMPPGSFEESSSPPHGEEGISDLRQRLVSRIAIQQKHSSGDDSPAPDPVEEGRDHESASELWLSHRRVRASGLPR
jgi:hypothetical protein